MADHFGPPFYFVRVQAVACTLNRFELLLYGRLVVFRVVGRRLVAPYGVLGVVVIVAEAFGTLVRGDGSGAVAFGVVGVAHLDVGPDGQPRRADVAAVKGGLEVVDG